MNWEEIKKKIIIFLHRCAHLCLVELLLLSVDVLV